MFQVIKMCQHIFRGVLCVLIGHFKTFYFSKIICIQIYSLWAGLLYISTSKWVTTPDLPILIYQATANCPRAIVSKVTSKCTTPRRKKIRSLHIFEEKKCKYFYNSKFALFLLPYSSLTIPWPKYNKIKTKFSLNLQK